MALASLLLLSWPGSSTAKVFTDRFDSQIQASTKRWWPDLPYWKLWKAQLAAESGLRPDVCSAAGACGLAQFMPSTWADMERALGWPKGASRFTPDLAIDGGAYYMRQLRRTWTTNRPTIERNKLAQASYNAGTGNILKAQRFCGNALLWGSIVECLPMVTGDKNAAETRGYVQRIARYWAVMEME